MTQAHSGIATIYEHPTYPGAAEASQPGIYWQLPVPVVEGLYVQNDTEFEDYVHQITNIPITEKAPSGAAIQLLDSITSLEGFVGIGIYRTRLHLSLTERTQKRWDKLAPKLYPQLGSLVVSKSIDRRPLEIARLNPRTGNYNSFGIVAA